MATEYERQRLENIKANNKILSSLGLAETPIAVVKDEPAVKKRKTAKAKVAAVKQEVQPRRVSLRKLGQDPDGTVAKTLKEEAEQRRELDEWSKARVKGTIEMNQEELDLTFLSQLQSLNEEPIEFAAASGLENEPKNSFQDYKNPIAFNGSVKVAREMIYAIDCHPSATKILAVVGDKKGSVGIWDVSDTIAKSQTGPEEEVEPNVITFKPHSRSISRIMHTTTDLNRVYTSSYDGSVRVMDINKQKFEEVYVHPEEHALGLFDIHESSLWFCTHHGEIGQMDIRARRESSAVYEASEKKLNTIHINPQTPHLLVTAGLDHIVRIFDARNLKTEAEPVKTFEHGKSVNSAFWDPVYGLDVLSLSFDDTIGVWKNAAGESSKHIAIRHNNNTGRWVQKFKACWRPFAHDGQSVFAVGNMTRRVDIYGGKAGRELASLSDPERLTAIPAVNVFHPNPSVGMIISGNASGRMSVWH
ncbi:hypothetical protein HDV03_005336 [Kappamyces sp. JEL0829]|nr:hypothetical protein HDV03_005336 [Kappamyces sp. JEL0829]